MPVRPVVANNTPLVAYWSISRLDILQALFQAIIIPPTVQEEFLAVDRDIRLLALHDSSWVKVTELANPGMVEAFAGLDRGEAEVLALAQEKNARLVLIDEKRARRYARKMRLPLSGTLGVLLLAKEAGVISSVTPLLSNLQEAGLYLHENLVDRILILAHEE